MKSCALASFAASSICHRGTQQLKEAHYEILTFPRHQQSNINHVNR